MAKDSTLCSTCQQRPPLGLPSWARYFIATCETCYEAKAARRRANRQAKLRRQTTNVTPVKRECTRTHDFRCCPVCGRSAPNRAQRRQAARTQNKAR